jgi:hypothetical protein
MGLGGKIGVWGSREIAMALLGLAVAASAVHLISLDSHLTFFADDWTLLLRRQGWSPDVFIDPYKAHLVLGPLLVYKVLQELFGIGSALPYYLVSTAFFLASAVLLFVYLRSRLGDWLALIGAVSILFLGAAFEGMLWVAPLNYYVSMGAGIAMLLCLDREDRRGDLIATGLLAVSVLFSNVGLAFAVGAMADVALGSRPWTRRLFVPLLPLAPFVIWWLGWSGDGGSSGFAPLDELPGFVFDAAAAGFTSLLGLATGDGSEPSQPHLIWGKLMLVAAAVLVVARIVKLRRLPRGLAVALAIGFAFWILIGIRPDFSAASEHSATSSRYQYLSAIFLLLILAEALRGVRVPLPVTTIAAVIVAFGVVGGISLLQREYDERWRPFAEATRYSLAAVEVAGESADPAFKVAFPPTLAVGDRTYLDAVERYGSPAHSEAELARGPAGERAGADLTIAQALGLALLAPEPGTRTIACQPLQASAGGPTGVTLLHGGFTLKNETTAATEVLLSRFADEPSVDLGPLAPGATTALTIPTDESSRPWSLALRGEGPVRLCTTEPG